MRLFVLFALARLLPYTVLLTLNALAAASSLPVRFAW
jgi:hypothetical protein